MSISILVLVAVLAGDNKPLGVVPDLIQKNFAKLDVDGSKDLTRDELLKGPGKPDVLKRDFQLFDFDTDGKLSLEEFWAIPGPIPDHLRGPVPDPYEDLLESAVAALDEAYGGWQAKPEKEINSVQFLNSFLTSLAPNQGLNSTDIEFLKIADANQNDLISRDEARVLLEMQLGLRWKDGTQLHEKNGRIVDLQYFQVLDMNSNGTIDKKEFQEKWWDKPNIDKKFATFDLDHDGKITLAEFSDLETGQRPDLLAWFRNSDTNLDGAIDAAELEAGAPSYRKIVAALTFPAFDLDRDGKLNWTEYRLSIFGNPVGQWNTLLTDANRDAKLTFDEFKFGKNEFTLLRRFYFSRFDANEDDSLTPDEYPFLQSPPNTISVLAANGSSFKPLYFNLEFPNMGSPDVSPDGKWIAFDGYRGGQGFGNSRLLLINSEGKDFKDLGDGAMPSWSNDGKKLAFSRNEEGGGIWTMNIDGSDKVRVGDGWGAQWSPDGNWIACTNNGGIWKYNVKTEEPVVILTRDQNPYQSIYWNMCWSPDSKRLVFKGDLKGGGADLASIDVSGNPDLKTHFSTKTSVNADLAWSADGSQILFLMQSKDHNNRTLLFRMSASEKTPPIVVQGIDDSLNHFACTLDRKNDRYILVTRGAKPVPSRPFPAFSD